MKFANDGELAAFRYGARLGALEERERIIEILLNRYWEHKGYGGYGISGLLFSYRSRPDNDELTFGDLGQVERMVIEAIKGENNKRLRN